MFGRDFPVEAPWWTGIVHVRVTDAEIEVSRGTGALMRDGHVLTALHVVKSKRNGVWGDFYNGAITCSFIGDDPRPAEIVEGALDDTYDFVWLKLMSDAPKSARVIELHKHGEVERPEDSGWFSFGFPERCISGLMVTGTLCGLIPAPHQPPDGEIGSVLQLECDQGVIGSIWAETVGTVPPEMRLHGLSGAPCLIGSPRSPRMIGIIVEHPHKKATGLLFASPITEMQKSQGWINLPPLNIQQKRIRWSVPELPPEYQERAELPELRKVLTSADGQRLGVEEQVLRVSLEGMGGIGKSVLAAALACDPDVADAFPDGIFWLAIGRTPDPPTILQSRLVRALGGEIPIRTISEGQDILRSLLANRSCLIVLDDVWHENQVGFLNVLGSACGLLVTTRKSEVSRRLGARGKPLDVLCRKDALELLARYAGCSLDAVPAEEGIEIATQCGRLPLALAMVGSMVRAHPGDWGYVLERLQQADLENITREFPGYPYPTLFVALDVSFTDMGEEERSRYLELAVFPDDVSIPESALVTYWGTIGLSGHQTHKVVNLFVDRSLARRDAGWRISLHDLQRDFTRCRLGDRRLFHMRLVDAYRGIAKEGLRCGPNDGYFYQNLFFHLIAADLKSQARQLLFDYRWLQARLDATDAFDLLSDYERFLAAVASDDTVRHLQCAIQLSTHVLQKDNTQLASQLTGRLLDYDNSDITELLKQAFTGPAQQGTCLQPISSSLTAPGGLVHRFLDGHSDGVYAIEVTPDGQRAVSAADDKTLRVWDLNTGKELHRLSEHSGRVYSIAVTQDSQRAVSAADDKTLRVWDLNTGKEVHCLSGHTGHVYSIAVTQDSQQAVSASYDNTLRVWDLNTGTELHCLSGQWDNACAVEVTQDGQRAVSASYDNTLRVWDLNAGKELHCLSGHSGRIYSIAVTQDGQRAVSASEDKTLRVWDLNAGTQLYCLTGHSGGVWAVVVTHDARRIVSTSSDETLRVWDLNTGKELDCLTGHSDVAWAVAVTQDNKRVVAVSFDTLRVLELSTGKELCCFNGNPGGIRAVAVTQDGNRAVSAPFLDGMLSVLDLQMGEDPRCRTGHSDVVRSVAVTQDGHRAVTASVDRTLRVWNVNTGKELHCLSGHSDVVSAIAVTQDGHRAISASGDGTLRVWDLNTGKELRCLTGHTACVYAVAVTQDGHQVVSASDDMTLRVWDLNTGKELHCMTGHSYGNCVVGVTQDGHRAVSASDDGTLRVWDLNAGKELHCMTGQLEGVRAIAVTQDGQSAISASKDKLFLWDLNTGKQRCCLVGHSDIVLAVAVTPDGQHAVSVSNDKTLHVWNLGAGISETCFFSDHGLTSCAVAPDGLTVVAGDTFGTVHFLGRRAPQKR